MERNAGIVPRLRFPEFRNVGDWKAGHCRDIANVLSGYGFPEKYQGNETGQFPFYKVSDISQAVNKGRKSISESKNYIDFDVLEKMRGKPVPTGTTIFAKIGEAIRLNRRVITTKPALIDNNMAGIKAIEKSSDEFLFYIWSNVSLIEHAGGVIPAVSKSKIENVPLCYPTDLAEQQKIASCLSSLDDLIAAEVQKLEALRRHKKALIQRLFPQPGETVPRLRFPEFRDMECYKKEVLSDLVCKVSTRNRSNEFQCVLSVTNHRGFVLAKDQFGRRVASSDVTNYKVIKRGQYAFNPSRINVGSIARLDDWENGLLSPMYAAFEIRGTKLHSDYFRYWLSTAKAKQSIKQKTQGSVRETVDFKSFISLAIVLPVISEQERIADCLCSLDDLITAQEDTLDSLLQHKRGLLQQLFPPSKNY